jgi:carbamoyl-phosphate synthase large subunit
MIPVYKVIDTCAAEFQAYTPYLYSTYEEEDESAVTDKKKIIILGGGPNRIGQGIEFDYCCVHGVFALQEAGYETIMVNCNPETVSTDYDTSDRLYFEPLTLEDVLNIIYREKPQGVIIQFGGQTPLKLALGLEKAGVPIIGTSPEGIDIAEDRERFKVLVQELDLLQPANGIARSHQEAEEIAREVGFPVVVRPSYVLGGRAMEIVHDMQDLRDYMEKAVKASPEHPVLIDKFLEDATELDVDLISDGKKVVLGAIMEHIEEAGIHSGDSACVIPAFSIKPSILKQVEKQGIQLAKALKVKGLMNIQFAIAKDQIYLLEVNPRASRTIPFVSKAIGVSLAKLAARVMAGETLEQLGFTEKIEINHVVVKESVFPFTKFPNVDILLGPEMRSTGEVMGMDQNIALAFAKAQMAASNHIPMEGTIFVSVRDKDKKPLLPHLKRLTELNYKILATEGTHEFLLKNGVSASRVNKVQEGRPHIVDKLKTKEVQAVINTTEGKEAIADSFSIRRNSILLSIPYFTTLSAAKAAIGAMEALKTRGIEVQSLQEYHQKY